MQSTACFLFAVAFALGGAAVPSLANVPNPAASSVDPCLIACPAGDLDFHVVVRDFGSNPVFGSTLTLDFCDCPTAAICPANRSQSYTVISCRVSMSSDAHGVELRLQLGSFDKYRATIDINQPINEKFAVRMNLLAQTGNTWRQREWERRKGMDFALTYNVTPKFSIRGE